MMQSAAPPGRQREQKLLERLDEVQTEIEELRLALPSVNDPVLRAPAEALAETAARVVTAHRDRPGPDIADDLAGLMSAAHTLRLPAQDPELGRTETLQILRKAKGLIVSALGDALDATRALGLYPRQAQLPQEIPMEVPRSTNEELFRGITKRLDEVVERLDALDNTKAEQPNFPQQTGLLNFYLGAMRVEVDLARLHLKVGEETIDFGALARLVEIMTELTGDFVATVRAWVGRVSDPVTRIAEEVRSRVRRLAAGTRTAAKWIGRKARLARAVPAEPNHLLLLDGRSEGMEVSFDPSDPECVAQVPVHAFNQDGVQGSWSATSIRVRVQVVSDEALRDVTAYITKIEKLTSGRKWQESDWPMIQTTWTDTNDIVTNIPGKGAKYVNVLHIDHPGNKINIWQRPGLAPLLADFIKDVTTYRFTVSVTGQGVTKNAQIEMDWKGSWDTIDWPSAKDRA